MIMVSIDKLFYTQQPNTQQHQQQQHNLDNKDNIQEQHTNDSSEGESPPPYTDVVNNSRLLDNK